jgi:hypothetical protein
MAALDAPTQTRIARSRQWRCPAPPPRRAATRSGAATIGVELRRTVPRVAPPVAPTHTLAPPPIHADPEPRRSRRWLVLLIAALAAGLTTGAALALSGVGVVAPGKAGPTHAEALAAVRGLGTQQSAPQDVSTTFTVDQSSLFDLGGPVRYRAVGPAQATVDLGAVGASDLQVRGRRASVRIPAAQLDPPVVDPSRSGAVTRDRGLGSELSGDVTASDVQSQAQQALADAAQSQGVPSAAQQLATVRVRATLRRLGFRVVDVSVAGA